PVPDGLPGPTGQRPIPALPSADGGGCHPAASDESRAHGGNLSRRTSGGLPPGPETAPFPAPKALPASGPPRAGTAVCRTRFKAFQRPAHGVAPLNRITAGIRRHLTLLTPARPVPW